MSDIGTLDCEMRDVYLGPLHTPLFFDREFSALLPIDRKVVPYGSGVGLGRWE